MTGVDLPETAALPWMEIQAPKGLDKVPSVTDLGAGEKEVLGLGMQFTGSIVILDDRLGRRYADTLKLSTTSTLGILLRARLEGRTLQIGPVLTELDRLRFRLSRRTRAAVLKQAGEDPG